VSHAPDVSAEQTDAEEVARLDPAAVRSTSSAVDGRSRGAAALLELQRTAGNRAVGRMLRRRTASPPQRRRLLRRRLPNASELQDILSDVSGGSRVASADAAISQAGLQRLWARIDTELTAAEHADLFAVGVTGLTVAQLSVLPAPDQASKWATGWTAVNALQPWELQRHWAEALFKVKPELQLGDPRLIDIGPRPATADAANIQTLVDNANKVFDKIAAGAQDADVKQVFGNANLVKAKKKYAEGRKWMNKLKTTNHIVTDRSGYNREVSLGGLTGFQAQISLEPDAIDNPNKRESVVTLIHESMHAGNGDVSDKGYINQPSFDKLPEDVKLTNAAHFEVVPRRVLPKDDPADPADPFAFAGQTFTPAGSAGPGGAVTPPLTPRQQAIRGASEMFREAWGLGLNLHMLFVQVYKTPSDWDTLDLSTQFGGVPAGTHFSDVLPFWSKVEKLTIHERTHINAAAGKMSTNPVTLIDIALSEGLVRKLSAAQDAVPQTEADADAFEKANATGAEIAAATGSVNGERDFLMKLVLSKRVGSITGSTDRDFRAATQMGTMPGDWKTILKVRSPATFAD
jgi:hypothetical protein